MPAFRIEKWPSYLLITTTAFDPSVGQGAIQGTGFAEPTCNGREFGHGIAGQLFGGQCGRGRRHPNLQSTDWPVATGFGRDNRSLCRLLARWTAGRRSGFSHGQARSSRRCADWAARPRIDSAHGMGSRCNGYLAVWKIAGVDGRRQANPGVGAPLGPTSIAALPVSAR